MMWYIRLYYRTGLVIDVTFSRRKDAEAAADELNEELHSDYHEQHPDRPHWYDLSQYGNTADIVNLRELLHVSWDSNVKKEVR